MDNSSSSNKQANSSFIGATMLISSLTLVSRIAGLGRDALCARVFGAGPIWSSFALAFLLPNLFRRLFGEGALSAALIPEYTRTLEHNPDEARRLATATLLTVAVVLGIVCLLGEVVLLLLLTQTSLGQHGGLTIHLAILMLPYAVLICLTAALGGMLQCHSVFAPTAAAPIILNCCIILAAVVSTTMLQLDAQDAILAVSGSVILAGLLQTTWSYLALRHVGGWTWHTTGTRQHLKRMAIQMMPVIIGLGTLQLNTLLDGLLAGWPVLVGPTVTLPMLGTFDYPLDTAANSVLFYAQRLYQFPLGVFGIALATAVFPMLARHAKDEALFTQTLRRSVRLALFVGIPASVGILAVRTDLVTLLFQGGAFESSDSMRVARVLLAYSPAIWAATLAHTLTRAFYAQGQTKTPMRIALVAVFCNAVLNLLLIVPLKEVGLALSTSISTTIQVLLLWVFLRRSRGSILTSQDLRAISNTLLGTLMMAAALLATGLGFRASSSEAMWLVLARLLAGVALGAVVFGGIAWIRKQDEIRWLVRRRFDDDTDLS